MTYGPIKRSHSNVRSKVSSRIIDSKVNKASAQQCYEKYMAMANDCITMGDRISAESFYQHAEHYLRVLNELKATAAISLLHPVESAP